jgi:hypothetical protein
VLELEQRLLAKVGAVNPQPLDAFYARPSVDAMDIYLGELGQAFMLTLVANQQVPRSAVWGERTMLEWPLNMALQWPQAEVPKLMYISGLGKAFDYQSEVLGEYKSVRWNCCAPPRRKTARRHSLRLWSGKYLACRMNSAPGSKICQRTPARLMLSGSRALPKSSRSKSGIM